MRKRVRKKVVKKVIGDNSVKVEKFTFNKPVLVSWVDKLKSGSSDQVIKEILISIEKVEKKKIIYKKDSKVRVPRETVKVAEEFRNNLISEPTKSEVTFGKVLREFSIPFEFQKIFYYYEGTRRKFYIVDFYLKDHNLVIEVDGKYHNDVEVMDNDRKRTEILLQSGAIQHVVRLSNNDVDKYTDAIRQTIYNIQQGRYKVKREVNGVKVKERVATQ